MSRYTLDSKVSFTIFSQSFSIDVFQKIEKYVHVWRLIMYKVKIEGMQHIQKTLYVDKFFLKKT